MALSSILAGSLSHLKVFSSVLKKNLSICGEYLPRPSDVTSYCTRIFRQYLDKILFIVKGLIEDAYILVFWKKCHL